MINDVANFIILLQADIFIICHVMQIAGPS